MKHIIASTAISNAEKKQYLNANGWSERLVADNWINNADAEAGHVNIEWGGLRLDEAYNRCRWQVFKGDFLRVIKKQPLNSISMNPQNGAFSLEWLEGGKVYRVFGIFDGYGFRVGMEWKEEAPGVSTSLPKPEYIKAVRFQKREINTPEQFVELFYNSFKRY